VNDGRSASLEVTALIAGWIKAQQEGGASITDIAKKLGVSRTQIYNLIDGSRGAGAALETNFANLEYGGSVDKLRKAARDAEQRAEVRRTEELPPNLRAAFAAVRGLGPVPDQVVKKARAMAAAGGDLPPTVWMAVHGGRRPRAAS
jgi:transposase-like protein